MALRTEQVKIIGLTLEQILQKYFVFVKRKTLQKFVPVLREASAVARNKNKIVMFKNFSEV